MKENKYTIGITIGDVNGIGPEVIIKTLADNRILNFCTPVIYGSSRAMSFYKKMLGAETFNYHIVNDIDQINPKSINILNCTTGDAEITPGEEQEDAAKLAIEALDACAADLVNGKIDGMVTAPVNKHSLNKINPTFLGQTEYLQFKAGAKSNLMLLVSEQLRVGLATNHVPLKAVADNINGDILLEKLRVMHQSLKRDFEIDKPKIAVLGLNPHAGDGSAIGDEEENVIKPVLESARAENILALGPYPADGFFGSSAWQQFDAILAIYHDQGLIPFKAISFGSGVNFTAGLPVVRTSPDHGTAYDIAGKNKASEHSFREALFLAISVIAGRKSYNEKHGNPMKKAQLSRETT